MPSDKPDEVKKWRHPVSAVQTLEPAAFAEKVIENGLRVVGPFQGYLYAAVKTDDGYDMLRMPQQERYYIMERRVLQQTNAAGGAMIADLQCASGQSFKIVMCRIVNSGTNTITATAIDEDNNTIVALAEIASAANTKAHLPSIGQPANTTGNIVDCKDMWFNRETRLSIYQSGAGAQNDQLQIGYCMEVKGATDLLTWSKARSTNAADVTLAASSVSVSLATVVDQP